MSKKRFKVRWDQDAYVIWDSEVKAYFCEAQHGGGIGYELFDTYAKARYAAEKLNRVGVEIEFTEDTDVGSDQPN